MQHLTRITDKVIDERQAWSARPLDEVYAAILIDAIVVKARDGQVANRPIYAAIGVSLDRLVGAVLTEQHDQWIEGRHYLGLDVLARARGDNPTTTESTEEAKPALTA